MMKIAFDLDDVLGEFNQQWLIFNNENYGMKLKYEDFTAFEYVKTFKIPKEEVFRRIYEFYDTKEFANLKVCEGAKEIVDKLKIKHDLCVLTSRDIKFEEVTINWIKNNFDDSFNNIYITNQFTTTGITHHVTKGDFCKEYNIDLLVEDAPMYAKDACEKGIKVAFVERPWNVDYDFVHPNMIRIKDFKELIQICE